MRFLFAWISHRSRTFSLKRALFAMFAAILLLPVFASGSAAANSTDIDSQIAATQAEIATLEGSVAKFDDWIRVLGPGKEVLAYSGVDKIERWNKDAYSRYLGNLVASGQMSPKDAKILAYISLVFTRTVLKTVKDEKANSLTALGKARDRLSYLYSQKSRRASQAVPLGPGLSEQAPPPDFKQPVRGQFSSLTLNQQGEPTYHAHGKWHNTWKDSGEWDLTLTLYSGGRAEGNWGGAQNHITGTWGGNTVHWIDGPYDVTCTLPATAGGQIKVHYEVKSRGYSGDWESTRGN